jgi:hypothetical protein
MLNFLMNSMRRFNNNKSRRGCRNIGREMKHIKYNYVAMKIIEHNYT